MWNLNEVVSVEYLGKGVFHVQFDDGLEGELDLSEYQQIGPVFAPLKEEEFCRNVRIEGGTLCWPNGADIAPEALYEKLQSANKAGRANRDCARAPSR